jgi:putative phage-type endonuclease
MQINREKWLEERKSGIGASEAAAIMGLSPYMTAKKLWQIKTGRKQPKDLSDNAFVEYGTKAEEHIRALFALDHPEYVVGYEEFKIIHNPKYPFIFATLDGTLAKDSEKGILEIKTASIFRSSQWEKWNGQVPPHYYVQILHQMLATGWDFVILKARIKHGDEITEREYTFRRTDCEQDLETLLQAEIRFWQCVELDVEPKEAFHE